MEAKMYQLLSDYCDYMCDILSSSFWLELSTEPNKFYAYFKGEQGTLHEGAIYKADIIIPIDYPNKQPTVRFSVPLPYHCNISQDGRLSLEYLYNWKQSCTLNYLLEQISNFLHNQNPHNPFRCYIGQECMNSYAEYEQNVRRQAETCKNAFSS